MSKRAFFCFFEQGLRALLSPSGQDEKPAFAQTQTQRRQRALFFWRERGEDAAARQGGKPRKSGRERMGLDFSPTLPFDLADLTWSGDVRDASAGVGLVSLPTRGRPR